MKRVIKILLVLAVIAVIFSFAYVYIAYDKFRNTLEEISVADEQELPRQLSFEEKGKKGVIGVPSEQGQTILEQQASEGTSIVKPRKHYAERIKEKKLSFNDDQSGMKQKMVLLLYGIDKRSNTYDVGRPDVLMLALLDTMKKRVLVISIPRDMYVNIPSYGRNKLNTSYSKGGINLTIETIEKWLGTDIDGYVSIDFEGFKKLVDLFGGIEMFVDRDMHYDSSEEATHIHLNKGFQVLNGKQTLDFVRFRYSNSGHTDSDYQRMERQQKVITKLSEKIVSYRSLPKVYHVLDVMSKNVKTSLAPEEISYLIRRLYTFNIHNLDRTSIKGTGHYQNKMWVEIVSDEEEKRIQQLIENFMQPKSED